MMRRADLYSAPFYLSGKRTTKTLYLTKIDIYFAKVNLNTENLISLKIVLFFNFDTSFYAGESKPGYYLPTFAIHGLIN
jgi:hypothetical protein